MPISEPIVWSSGSYPPPAAGICAVPLFEQLIPLSPVDLLIGQPASNELATSEASVLAGGEPSNTCIGVHAPYSTPHL